jgi:hypothetical protein
MSYPRRYPDAATRYAAWCARQVIVPQVCCVCGRLFTPALSVWIRHKHAPARRWCCSRACSGALGGQGLWAWQGEEEARQWLRLRLQYDWLRGHRMTEFTRGDTPQNLDEMPNKFFELEDINIAEWGPARDGKGPQTQVHLLLTMTEMPEVTFVLRCKGPDTLSMLITALTQHGLNVFGRDLAQRLRDTERAWKAQG